MKRLDATAIVESYRALPSQAQTAGTVNGAAVDTKGKHGSVIWHMVAPSCGPGTTLDVSIEESADGSTGWTNVYSFPQVNELLPSELWRTIRIGDGTGRKRYQRCKAVTAGIGLSLFAVLYEWVPDDNLPPSHVGG
jgi:hypothetical protein